MAPSKGAAAALTAALLKRAPSIVCGAAQAALQRHHRITTTLKGMGVSPPRGHCDTAQAKRRVAYPQRDYGNEVRASW
eukprot:gene42951-569_t